MKERIENSLTLEDILSNKKYSVNYYQREYRWGRKQVEQLIEDLTNSFDDSFDRKIRLLLYGHDYCHWKSRCEIYY